MGERRKRRAFPRLFLGVIWMTGLGLAAGSAASADEGQGGLAEGFEVGLEAVELSTRVSVRSENGAMVCGVPERILTVSLRFDMADPNRPVAIDTNPPTMLGVYDDVGQDVNCRIASADGVRSYEEVTREDVWVEGDSKVAGRLLPSGLPIDLVLDPNQPVPSSLSRVEGYVYVLCAEQIIEADVAFEAGAEWVDGQGDLHISVSPRTPPTPGPIEYEAVPEVGGAAASYRPTTPIALWKYETRVYSATGDVLALDGLWVSGPSVDDYVLIKTELIDIDGSVTFIREVSDQSNGFGNRNDCYCFGQVEQSARDYDSIRHIIAVHPVEIRVPFVLRDVPIPSLQLALD